MERNSLSLRVHVSRKFVKSGKYVNFREIDAYMYDFFAIFCRYRFFDIFSHFVVIPLARSTKLLSVW